MSIENSFLITEIAPSAKDVAELKRLRDALSSNVREESFKKAQEVQTKIDKVEEKISSSTKIFQGNRFAININNRAKILLKSHFHQSFTSHVVYNCNYRRSPHFMIFSTKGNHKMQGIPYACHYNPRFVCFKPTFWRSKTFVQGGFFWENSAFLYG